MKRENKPGASAPKPRPNHAPSKSQQGEARVGTMEKLREMDTLDVDFGDDFYNNMHDRIMARIEKTPVEVPPAKPVQRKALSHELTLVTSGR